ncbi:type III-A CRISPR-associated protein Csm2 [Nitratifractor sp.]
MSCRKIELDYRKDPELFNETAKCWAKAIGHTKKTQARNFYEKILELEKSIREGDFAEVYPFIKMLNSKVAYGVSRKVVSREFQEMMTQCLDQITNDEAGRKRFENFKLFFEAVLGFFKGGN